MHQLAKIRLQYMLGPKKTQYKSIQIRTQNRVYEHQLYIFIPIFHPEPLLSNPPSPPLKRKTLGFFFPI
jgi:hypothetical protein